MTNNEARIKDAFKRSGLALQGYTFREAMTIRPIRIALECLVKAADKKQAAPQQRVLL